MPALVKFVAQRGHRWCGGEQQDHRRDGGREQYPDPASTRRDPPDMR